MPKVSGLFRQFLLAAGLLSAADIILFIFRALLTGTGRYSFIPGNLALAWLSLAFAWLLTRNVRQKRWSDWQNIGLTLLWLSFLPNAWYVLTDFIHVYPNPEISQLFDIVLIWLLVFTCFALGIASLFLIQRLLLARHSKADSWLFIEAAILLSSFAVYLGRDLRWNSWDIIANPTGLLVNVSDRIADPLGSPRALNITLLFFFLINLTYLAFWIMTQPPKRR